MKEYTLEYWRDEDGYAGRLKEAPNVMSQDEILDELRENIRDAYALVMEAAETIPYTTAIHHSPIHSRFRPPVSAPAFSLYKGGRKAEAWRRNGGSAE